MLFREVRNGICNRIFLSLSLSLSPDKLFFESVIYDPEKVSRE